MDTNETLLSDLEQGIAHEPASIGIRFANYLIDVIGFYVLVFLFGILYGLMQTDSGYYEEEETIAGAVRNLLVTYAIYLLYYTLFEGMTKGRSLGKLLTGTVAVRNDGSTITWTDAFLRSLSRLVPFEPFSAFGRAPWHDSWTKTMVVKKN